MGMKLEYYDGNPKYCPKCGLELSYVRGHKTGTYDVYSGDEIIIEDGREVKSCYEHGKIFIKTSTTNGKWMMAIPVRNDSL